MLSVSADAEAAGISAPHEMLVYLNFEGERLSGLEAEALTFALDEYFRTHPSLRGREKVMLCLDEIQLVKGWESFLRRILDSEKGLSFQWSAQWAIRA